MLFIKIKTQIMWSLLFCDSTSSHVLLVFFPCKRIKDFAISFKYLSPKYFFFHPFVDERGHNESKWIWKLWWTNVCIQASCCKEVEHFLFSNLLFHVFIWWENVSLMITMVIFVWDLSNRIFMNYGQDEFCEWQIKAHT